MTSYVFDYLYVQAPKEGLLFLSNKFIAGQSSCCLLLFYTHITQLISSITPPMMVGCWTGFACHRATLDQQWGNVGLAEVGYSSNCFCTGKYADDLPCVGSAHYVLCSGAGPSRLWQGWVNFHPCGHDINVQLNCVNFIKSCRLFICCNCDRN